MELHVSVSTRNNINYHPWVGDCSQPNPSVGQASPHPLAAAKRGHTKNQTSSDPITPQSPKIQA